MTTALDNKKLAYDSWYDNHMPESTMNLAAALYEQFLHSFVG
jgi:hypothetical protein